jgi:hypothetical protein
VPAPKSNDINRSIKNEQRKIKKKKEQPSEELKRDKGCMLGLRGAFHVLWRSF